MKETKAINQFLDEVLSQVKFQEAHREIRTELTSHFDSAFEQLKNSNLSESQIQALILKNMGSSDELGKKLDEVHRSQIDLRLVGFAVSLIALGFLTQFKLEHFGLQMLWGGLGLLPCLGLILVRPQTIQKASFIVYLTTLGLGAISFLTGTRYDGQPYLSIGSLHIKFVDLSVLLFVVGLSGMFASYKKNTLLKNGISLIAIAIPLIAYLAIGSIYPAITFFTACLVSMIVSRWAVSAILVTAGTGMFLILSFINRQLFVSGEIFSRVVVSERHTDFVFNFLQSSSSSLAAITAAIALCLVVYLILVSKEIKSVFGRTITAAATTILSVGIILGLLSNLGFIPMPVTGINFPFLSYGGSLLLGHMALIGIILGQQRRKNIRLFA